MKVAFLSSLLFLMAGCATIPQKLAGNVELPVTFESVGYRDNYWEFGFDHIADLTIYNDKIILLDDEVNLPILFSAITDIKYEHPIIEWSNYIIVSYRDGGSVKTAYFTSMKNLGWTPGTSRIYQNLIYAYENRKS